MGRRYVERRVAVLLLALPVQRLAVFLILTTTTVLYLAYLVLTCLSLEKRFLAALRSLNMVVSSVPFGVQSAPVDRRTLDQFRVLSSGQPPTSAIGCFSTSFVRPGQPGVNVW